MGIRIMMTLFLCQWLYNTLLIVKFHINQKFIFLIFKKVNIIECLQGVCPKLSAYKVTAYIQLSAYKTTEEFLSI